MPGARSDWITQFVRFFLKPTKGSLARSPSTCTGSLELSEITEGLFIWPDIIFRSALDIPAVAGWQFDLNSPLRNSDQEPW